MNNDDTQGAAEPSPASAGSQPVAWAVFEADGNCVGTYAHQEHALIVMEELAYDGMVYEPLYRKPMLADAELKAIRRAAAVAREMHDTRLEAALGNLLERLG